MNVDSQRGPALLIADILEKYLGEIITLEEQLEISFAYKMHTKFNYVFIGSEICMIDVQKEFWDIKRTQEKLVDLEKSFNRLIIDFDNLPARVRWAIERQATQYIQKHDHEYKNMPDKIKLGHKYDHVLPISFALENLSLILQLNEKETAFKAATSSNKPLKAIKLRQSQEKFRKILIIDKLRFLWIIRKKDKPNSIPYEGSEFGDMTSEIFEILDIKSDVRAAMDAWRKEMNT